MLAIILHLQSYQSNYALISLVVKIEERWQTGGIVGGGSVGGGEVVGCRRGRGGVQCDDVGTDVTGGSRSRSCVACHF